MKKLACWLAAMGLLGAGAFAAPAAAAPSPPPPRAGGGAAGGGAPGARRRPGRGRGPAPPLTPPGAVLPRGWAKSTDRAVTTAGDENGLRVVVAEESSGYRWRTAAVLAEEGFDTSQWIGTACVTGSGRRAVVVYAPREFTNRAAAMAAGGFVAVVDLGTGAVRKLAVHASLAYYSPGCGTGEEVTLPALTEAASSTTTTVALVDAATGATRWTTRVAGQVTSPVPYAGGVAAVAGTNLVLLHRTGPAKLLTRERTVPFRLHPDAGGGLAYEVPDGNRVGLRRFAAGRSTLAGTGDRSRVRLTASAGRVFVNGPGSAAVADRPGWTRLAVPVDAEPSTSGTLAVLGTTAGSVRAMTTANRRTFTFAVPEATAPVALSPAPATARALQGTDPATVPWDPDRGCAVPRNDPAIQTLQATAAQVEWAVDQAVSGRLTITRPANWSGSGMPVSWQPQVLFKPHELNGGGAVPAQVLLGALAQESNTMQASPHAVDGLTGNFNQGGFYGWGSQASWANVDCGYGVGQVTTGMSVAAGSTVYTPNQQLAIATDYASNVAASMNALIDKWNALRAANIIAGNGDSRYVENWYLAAWAYNTGLQPNAANGNTTGCAPGPACTDGQGNWGLGWANNPANPSYPYDRGTFDGNNSYHTKHPNLWPYQEKVIGWAYTPVGRYDYARKGWYPSYAAAANNDGKPQLPDTSTFCDYDANHCLPHVATDVNGRPGAGSCLRSDFHCWWHRPVSWVTCEVQQPTDVSPCGVQILTYAPGAAEPPTPSVYPPDCDVSGLPANAVIVDEVTTPSVAPCRKTWSDQGRFTLNFPSTTPAGCTARCITYRGKIDFHQVGTGFGGHLWFAHMQSTPSVTGTWTPPATTTGWTRIKVHIPRGGATTQQADYVIRLGDGRIRHRVVNQDWWQNTWMDLGTFELSAGASVSLSNASSHVAAGRADGGDVGYDAVAFIPSSRPSVRYVALGDSYSSGEGNSPYEPDTSRVDDNGADINQCHRSLTQAYATSVRLPGHADPIATEAAHNGADFHLLACSGALTIHLTQDAVDTGNQDNTSWGHAHEYRFGEVSQIDDSGWLDDDTTLVTVSIGGNDVGFADVVRGCIVAINFCTADTFKLTRSTGVDPQPLTTYEPYLIDRLRRHLTAVYEKIHVYAPNARIVVVGYPHLFSVTTGVFCLGLPSSVQDWMNSMGDRMAQTIAGAIADTRTDYPNTAISFADPRSAFGGHEVCSSGLSPWINSYVVTDESASFHPNSLGHRAYTDLVNGAL